jgi:PTS system nitrogen regulatory IIA component
MPDDSTLRIRDILDPRRVQLHVDGSGKREILAVLVAPIAVTHPSIDREALVDALLEREQTSSTAIADGIAIPHGRHSVGDKVVCAFGRNRDGLDFDSIDGTPTQIFFVLVSPETRPTLHLRWLAHLAVLLRNPEFRETLLSADSPDAVIAAIEHAEQAQAQGTRGK